MFACIRLAQPVADTDKTAQDITRYCLDQLAYYKAPGYVAFVSDLLSVNRRLLEDIQYRLKRRDYYKSHDKSQG